MEANNAVYGPGGPFARLFPSNADRVAFAKTAESRQIDELIDSLPGPPVGLEFRRLPDAASKRPTMRASTVSCGSLASVATDSAI